MVSGHEQPHIANLDDDPYDRQMDRLVDQGVATPYGAAAQVLDFDPQHQSVVRDPQATAKDTRRPHYSHRGGRSFPEPSDSELDPNWHVSELTPLPNSDVLTNRVAVSVIQQMLRAKYADPDAQKAHEAHLDEVRARADEDLRRFQ